MTQATENRPRGRPRKLNLDELLHWEGVWVSLFCGLRDGSSETKQERRGSSGVFVRAAHDAEKIYVSSGTEIQEKKGRETIYTMIPGEQPRKIVQPKFIESPEQMSQWQNDKRRLEEEFHRTVMGDDPTTQRVRAKWGERHIWEALKRARTAAQVRRAYSRSKIWLISRLDFSKGHYLDWSWSPYPRELYRRAQEFCDAKLDRRYPGHDTRPTGDYRRIEYLARVMAGYSVVKPISWSYSVEVLRKIKHMRSCACWRCTYRIAPRYRRSLVEFLSKHPF